MGDCDVPVSAGAESPVKYHLLCVKILTRATHTLSLHDALPIWLSGKPEKLATEAPINGGRNYDGPKVAKFLVG